MTIIFRSSGYDEDELVERAARRGLALEGLAAYSMGGPQRGPALVIGYAAPPE